METSSMFESKKVEAGGKTFTVHEITVKQRKEIFSQHKEDGDATTMAANLVLFGCDQFKEKSIDDVLELPGTVFDKISSAVADVSGMGGDDADDGEGEKKPAS
jgi:hypothetical protein